MLVPQRRQNQRAQQASDAYELGERGYGRAAPNEQPKQAARQPTADGSADRPAEIEGN